MKKIKRLTLFMAVFIFTQFISAQWVPAETDGYSFRDVYSVISDEDTSRFLDYFSPSTLENGYLWVDKTVNTDSASFYDTTGNKTTNVNSSQDDFLITLSALSQSYSVDTVVEPTDAVFILDVSASMDVYRLGGLTRATVMIQALNNAIDSLMTANPDNRIAVVSYGGYSQGTGSNQTNLSRINQLLSLNHYTVSNGQYFSISGNTITVNSELYTQGTSDKTISVSGSTPTQRGIYEGAKILMDNKDTLYSYVSDKGKTITMTRKPAIILLTDGEPTMAWRDYRITGKSTDNGYDSGDGNPSSIDLGMSLLTIATASYWKQQVSDHYYGTSSDKSPQFYTIGVGVESAFAEAVMDPQRNAQNVSYYYSSNRVTYNLKTLLDSFITGKAIEFPVQRKGSTTRELITIENPGTYVKSYSYTDGYFPANDQQALKDAFHTIAAQIISKGYYTTEADPARPDFSGYVVISDIVGDHMRFREQKGFILAGEKHFGGDLARELIRGSTSAVWAPYIRVLTERLGVSKSIAEDIVRTSIKGGSIYYNNDSDNKCVLQWYADTDTEYAGLFYNDLGNVTTPPSSAACIVELYPLDSPVYNEVSEQFTNLMYTYMSVTTALTSGGFGLKSVPGVTMPLNEGQQMVRWYIPSSLLPMRTITPVFDESGLEITERLNIKEALPIRVNYTVGLENGFSINNVSEAYKRLNSNGKGGYYFYSNSWQYNGALKHDTTAAFFQPNKENPYYYFTKDTPVYVQSGGGYSPADSFTAGTAYYVLNEYFDQNVPNYLVIKYEPVDQNITKIYVSPEGKPYIPTGEHTANCIKNIKKNQNMTDTYDFKLVSEYVGDTEIYLLGNNGRLEIPALSQIIVRKNWDGEEFPVWVQLYANGAPILSPVELNESNYWQHTWPELLTYSTEMNNNGKVIKNEYTVAEGFMLNNVFVPYDEENPLEGYEIQYIQPVWDDISGFWTDAIIENIEEAEETAIPTEEPTPSPTETVTPPDETDVPTDEPTPTPTETVTPTDETEIPTDEPTPSPTETVTPPDETEIPTEEPAPSPTVTITPPDETDLLPIETVTPSPSNTLTPTPTTLPEVGYTPPYRTPPPITLPTPGPLPFAAPEGIIPPEMVSELPTEIAPLGVIETETDNITIIDENEIPKGADTVSAEDKENPDAILENEEIPKSNPQTSDRLNSVFMFFMYIVTAVGIGYFVWKEAHVKRK